VRISYELNLRVLIDSESTCVTLIDDISASNNSNIRSGNNNKLVTAPAHQSNPLLTDNDVYNDDGDDDDDDNNNNIPKANPLILCSRKVSSRLPI